MSRLTQSLALVLIAAIPLVGCATTAPDCPPTTAPDCPQAAAPMAPSPAVLESGIPEELYPKSEVIEIPIVVAPTITRDIPKGSRIVIAGITGPCSVELTNALMKRLVDNSEYEVLTRDNLQQLLGEIQKNWSGNFNTETTARLGELMGASLFIVGNVVYCGKTEIEEDDEDSWQYDILAVLQILDLETSKVLMSSADRGEYEPRASQLLIPADPPSTEVLGSETEGSQVTGIEAEVNFPAFKAAEDLANDFADKFFSRPTWESLKMWKNDYWHYGDSIRYVKLGHCSRAVKLLESVAAQELRSMPEKFVAEYLHNYGVALLCDNKAPEAMDKLRSAFRITYEPSSLQMLDLAARFEEWKFEVRPDLEPEIEMLTRRKGVSVR